MKVHMLMDGEFAPGKNPTVCHWNQWNTLKTTRNPKEVTCLRCLSSMEGSYRAFGKYAEFFEEKED